MMSSVPSPPSAQLIRLDTLPHRVDGAGEAQTLVYEPVNPRGAWNEAIVSWNFDSMPGVRCKIEVRPIRGAQVGPWFSMGQWDLAQSPSYRTSISSPDSEWGTVNTDTLHLNRQATQLQVRVETNHPEALKLLTVAISQTGTTQTPDEADKAAWGKLIEVPKRAQMDYPNGAVICSATSTSMLIDHWAQALNSPSLDRDVPLVVAGVYDPQWKGTGNWPFNMAYAGSLPGMTAYVSRFNSMRDLEVLIAAGYPVATSVSYNLLQGKEKTGDDGHLVVLVGFTDDGDPIFNDPGRSVVRMTYKRADFERAWADSDRTVYLIYPSDSPLPPSPDHVWLSQ